MPASSQTGPKCAFDRTIQSVIAGNPALADTFEAVRSGVRQPVRAAAKTSAGPDSVIIPVVFHVILTSTQLGQIRNEEGIAQRIASQIDALNRDFNASNADSAKIPTPFKGLSGNAGVSFALAHTAPDGTATPGYEILTTTRPGFELEGEYGSGYGFSGAKHSEGGGADAWDTESYLNIWLINPLESGISTNILGLAIPTYIAGENNGIGHDEKGIVLHYGAFGYRVSPFDYYARGSDKGRTLTHEVGHYFDLLHIWGDDEGKCPDNGGRDDGIADTPPQQYSSSGCNVFPKYDACSKPGTNGIMFMNYMDYSVDSCLVLFTHGQVARMTAALQPGGDAYPLTQHPWLLSYPTSVSPANNYTIYPNPAHDRVNIVFRKQPEGLKSVHIVDLAGRVVVEKEIDRQVGFYTFSVSGLQAGIYLVVVEFESGKEVQKVFVR